MCELLGISSANPLDPQALLRAFRSRGGETADNPDGWGVAYLQDGRFTLHKEPIAAAHSQRFIELAGTVRSDLVIGHVRKARLPRVNTLANTHPFLHHCCGREWVFAHNGLVPEVIALALRAPHPPCMPDGETASAPSLARGPRLVPIGETDSEHAFCHLLENISRHFYEPQAADMEPWFEALAALSGLIATHGKFNFLISDGLHLIAYGHDRLHYHAPHAGSEAGVAWIATEPLTADPWQAFDRGELRVYRRGQFVGRVLTPRESVPATFTSARSMNAA
ncbi:MAG: class II glutamine amidotransferase [Gammaproteobacteria bacterium]|nr:class II glutamine amidotransferase [Gammaproteobacteria bacterium]